MTGNCALNIGILVYELDKSFKAGQTDLADLNQNFHRLAQLAGLFRLLLNVLHDELCGFNHSKQEGPEGEGS
jgi:hypothetical protein